MKRNKLIIFAFIMCVIFSTFSFVVSAVDTQEDSEVYTSIAPIYFSEFGNTLKAVAFPGPSTKELYIDGKTVDNILSNDDYYEHPANIKYANGVIPYIQIYLSTSYSSVYFNGVVYNGSLEIASSVINKYFSNVTSIDFYPVEHSASENTYHYTFNILLGEWFDYNTVYMEGFEDGKVVGKNEGYSEGYASAEEDMESKSEGGFISGIKNVGQSIGSGFKNAGQFIGSGFKKIGQSISSWWNGDSDEDSDADTGNNDSKLPEPIEDAWEFITKGDDGKGLLANLGIVSKETDEDKFDLSDVWKIVLLVLAIIPIIILVYFLVKYGVKIKGELEQYSNSENTKGRKK